MYTRQIVLEVKNIKTKADAEKLVGKKVVWNDPEGKKKVKIEGKVSAPHGSKGRVRAIMEKGLPGQAVGTEVEIL